ncbi:hypothetical protein ASF27_10075 [Methylobacterium sp. Leaf102]|uniref:hypothetical protein n=1 Tax=Methylobacterium sp. Leaf102 TaxID=1736253 RepID=UPI0006F59BC8|nr:hypothetical protein [Methylobacterium sp. Leaf102]KQP24454.1 hypothetical protein ASF27_10075 [Methylobacterium sp. Leaf102]
MASSSRLIEPAPHSQPFPVGGRRVSHALVLYEPAQEAECDGARTLRLVEQAVESMQALRERADYITAQAHDLIRLTNLERAQVEAELRKVREDKAAVERQMRDAEQALARANLRLREAELGRREAQVAAREAETRAVDAEARAVDAELREQGLASYLKKISAFLQVRLAVAEREA